MHIRKDFCKNIFEKINLQSALLYSTKYSVSKIAFCRGATGLFFKDNDCQFVGCVVYLLEDCANHNSNL